MFAQHVRVILENNFKEWWKILSLTWLKLNIFLANIRNFDNFFEKAKSFFKILSLFQEKSVLIYVFSLKELTLIVQALAEILGLPFSASTLLMGLRDVPFPGDLYTLSARCIVYNTV